MNYVTFIYHEGEWKTLFPPNESMKMNARLILWRSIRPLTTIRVIAEDDSVVFSGEARDFKIINE